jgi:hypothetical protein
MQNYIIPTTVVDNFFNDPYLVKDFAQKQNYTSDKFNQWPGERTESVHLLSPEFFSNTINKFLQIFYPSNEHIEWSGYGFFQRINSNYDRGWVHVDGTLITGIVYLNEDATLDAGTTIYQPKILGEQMLHVEQRCAANKDPTATKQYENYRLDNQNQFEESITVKNKFNRLVAFDSHLYHAGNQYFGTDANSRLTMVFFIDKLFTNAFPLQRLKRM